MTEYVTPTTWEECARHKERGGRVQHLSLISVEWGDDPSTPEQYRNQPGKPEGKHRRRLVPIPTPDEPETAEGDGLREKVSKEVAGALSPGYPLGLYYKITDAVLAVLPPQPAPSPVPPWPGAVLSWLCAERAKSATPEPPFEGAVPTGRVVDGEPTYYAVAGEVPADGWRARGGLKGSWARPSLLGSRIIVEARRVPAPATERVELWDVVGRSLPDGREIVGWRWSTEARDGSVTHDDGTFTPVHDAPTVEVLKDGDR